MTNTAWLPKFLRWMFAVSSVFMVLGIVAVSVVMLVNPSLPATAQFGPFDVEMLGQPGNIVLRSNHGDSVFAVTAFRGSMSMNVGAAGGLIELFKLYGFPLVLVYLAFFAVLFDLLRRLFRNVGRGESFTRQSVHLVQTIGVSLLVFSLVSAFGEGLFSHAMFTYLAQHTAVVINGSTVHFPAPQGFAFSSSGGSPIFFSGLLVLALSEVFRQGLALKNEHDLTV